MVQQTNTSSSHHQLQSKTDELEYCFGLARIRAGILSSSKMIVVLSQIGENNTNKSQNIPMRPKKIPHVGNCKYTRMCS